MATQHPATLPGWLHGLAGFVAGLAHLIIAIVRPFAEIAAAIVGGWVNFACCVFVVVLTAGVFYSTLLSPKAITRNRVRALRWRMRCYLKPAAGFASTPELLQHWSRTAALFHGRRGRADLSWWRRMCYPTDDIAVRLGRAQYGKRVFSRLEDNVGTLALPRTGKSADIADRILRHPGAVIASSARADLYLATYARRVWRKPACPWIVRWLTIRTPRPVHVFNPQHLSGVRTTFTWDLLATCRDMQAAMRMAAWLCGQNKSQNLEWFEDKGNVALGGLLLSASYCDGNDGRPLYTLRDVFSWVHSGGPQNCPAIPILNMLGHTEAAMLVTRLLSQDRTSGSIRDTIDRSLQWTVIPELAETVARDGDMFDYERMLRTGGTLYLINSGDESSIITPVIRALASWLHYEAMQIASCYPGQRLPVPLLMALDEVPNTCPIDLPGILSMAGGWGICVHWIAHSLAQLRKTWGDEDAETIIDTSGVIMVMPGVKNDATLEALSRLSGVRAGEDNEGQLGARLVPPALIRELPDWRALVIRTNRPVTVVRFRPYFKRFTYRWPWKIVTRLGPVRPSVPFRITLGVPDRLTVAGAAVTDADTDVLVPVAVGGPDDDDPADARPPVWPVGGDGSDAAPRPPKWTPSASPAGDGHGPARS
jgi:type IV secretion system protein VirD4